MKWAYIRVYNKEFTLVNKHEITNLGLEIMVIKDDDVMWVVPFDKDELTFHKDNHLNIKPNQFIMNLTKTFHWYWIYKLDLDSDWFKLINKTIKSKKQTETVISDENIYEQFKKDPRLIKTVILKSVNQKYETDDDETFILNVPLTIGNNEDEHLKIWKPFVDKVLNELNHSKTINLK